MGNAKGTDPSFFKFHRDLKLGRGLHLAGLHDLEIFDKIQKDAVTALENIGLDLGNNF